MPAMLRLHLSAVVMVRKQLKIFYENKKLKTSLIKGHYVFSANNTFLPVPAASPAHAPSGSPSTVPGAASLLYLSTNLLLICKLRAKTWESWTNLSFIYSGTGTGSGTVPSTGVRPSTDGNTIKLPFSLLAFMLFAASYNSIFMIYWFQFLNNQHALVITTYHCSLCYYRVSFRLRLYAIIISQPSSGLGWFCITKQITSSLPLSIKSIIWLQWIKHLFNVYHFKVKQEPVSKRTIIYNRSPSKEL